ncbi:MAG: PAS domain S-box protein, partial [Dehalococcoidia bacterium]
LAPQGDIGKLELADILDIDAIQSIMDDFHRLTNISAWILDLEGKILVSTGWRDICTRFHRVNPETCTNCVESDTQLSEGVAPGTFKIYKCKNNMWDLVTPIAVGNKHIGNLFLGQFLFDDEAVDDALFRSQARRYGFNEEEYLAALERVPRLSRQTLDSAMAFYSKFAHMISTLSHSNIQLARSLTEKNNLLSALQASETQYRLLAEHITDAVVLLDMNLKSTYLSPSVERARGFTAQEIKQIPLDKQMTPESFKIVSDLLMKELPKMEADPNYNPVHTLELELYRKDGSTLWAENKLSVIRDENGKAISILAESRDITDRKLAQIALVESEEKYRSLFHRAPIGIAVTTTDGIVIEINNAQAKMMGYEVEELRGKNAVDYYVNPDKRLEINKAVQKAGKLHDFEIELIRKDGSILTELLNFDQLQLGVSDFILVTGRDVTKLRQAEKAVRESEARYRLLAEHTTDTVGLMDKDLNTIYVSPSSEKLRGYTVQEIMEMPLDKHITNESLQLAADAIMKELPRVQADPDYNPVLSLELEYNRKDGTTLWMENKFSVIRDHSGNFMNILTEARDITERREYEKKLESTLAALEKTLRDTVIAISRIVEMKDPFTAGHQIRVAQLASSMARKMNLSDEEAAVLNTAATIHDIGKIYVPSDILSKPGKLNPLEYEIIQTHVRGSYEILKDIDFNGPIAQIVHQHHERMDGSGYPLGLKGPEILPLARILIVADVVEAMSSHRPYRAAMGVEKALDEITRNRGKLYDEAAVDACLDLFNNDRFRFSPVESSRIV